MGHSYIAGGELAFEVRDSVCEGILERWPDELARTGGSETALELVTQWYDYWFAPPPGCKDLI